MIVGVKKSQGGHKDEWCVEVVDHGETFVTMFSGSDAFGRAREYATWKYGLGRRRRDPIGKEEPQ